MLVLKSLRPAVPADEHMDTSPEAGLHPDSQHGRPYDTHAPLVSSHWGQVSHVLGSSLPALPRSRLLYGRLLARGRRRAARSRLRPSRLSGSWGQGSGGFGRTTSAGTPAAKFTRKEHRVGPPAVRTKAFSEGVMDLAVHRGVQLGVWRKPRNVPQRNIPDVRVHGHHPGPSQGEQCHTVRNLPSNPSEGLQLLHHGAVLHCGLAKAGQPARGITTVALQHLPRGGDDVRSSVPEAQLPQLRLRGPGQGRQAGEAVQHHSTTVIWPPNRGAVAQAQPLHHRGDPLDVVVLRAHERKQALLGILSKQPQPPHGLRNFGEPSLQGGHHASSSGWGGPLLVKLRQGNRVQLEVLPELSAEVGCTVLRRGQRGVLLEAKLNLGLCQALPQPNHMRPKHSEKFLARFRLPTKALPTSQGVEDVKLVPVLHPKAVPRRKRLAPPRLCPFSKLASNFH
eukprot:RCo049307